MLNRRVVALGAAVIALLGTAVGVSVAAPTTQTPIRAAFGYDWYPEGENWATHYTPALGKYDSSNPTVLAAHIAMAKYAGLDALISSWWGKDSKTAARLPLELAAAEAQSFHIAPYLETESLSPAPSDDALTADLGALYAQTTSPAWLVVDGKPVLFVYNTGTEASCDGIARLERINAGRFYLQAKVFGGYRTCPVQPESWHQYGPASPYDQQGKDSATVSPGFYKFNETTPRLARDPNRFATDLGRQVASGARWQLVTSFSEWGEGTSVEPAVEWQTPSGMGAYLDAMRAAYVTGTTPPPTTSSTTSTSTTTSSTTSSSATSSTTVPTTTTSSTSTSTTVPTTTSTSSTTATPPPAVKVDKILVIVEENHSLAQMQAGMPFLYGQAQTFGYADHWTAIRHPSLPNYLGLAGGSTFGVTDDGAPSVHPVAGRSVFGSAIGAGKTAAAYQEGMTSPCKLTNTGRYAVKHNPWAYFTDERSLCGQFDLPTGTTTAGPLHDAITGGTLPNVGLVTPDLCNDAHDCSLATADNWLRGWVEQIKAGPDYQSGRLAIVITADEDDSKSGNVVLTTIIHPSQAGRVVSTPLTHYSLTRLLTDLAGAPCLAAGCTAPDAAAAFNLPIR